MTNRLSLAFVAILLAALAADHLFNGLAGSLFLARKFADLVEWVAFWR